MHQKKLLFAFALLALTALTFQQCASSEAPPNSECTGCPPTFSNGLPCASTTQYEGGGIGSCGLEMKDGAFLNSPSKSFWTQSKYTAALNAANMNPSKFSAGWCAQGCMRCFRLCTTGGLVTAGDNNPASGVCKVFEITDRCPDGSTPSWCNNSKTYLECKAAEEIKKGSCGLGDTNK